MPVAFKQLSLPTFKIETPTLVVVVVVVGASVVGGVVGASVVGATVGASVGVPDDFLQTGVMSLLALPGEIPFQ